MSGDLMVIIDPQNDFIGERGCYAKSYPQCVSLILHKNPAQGDGDHKRQYYQAIKAHSVELISFCKKIAGLITFISLFLHFVKKKYVKP
jgi:hypothetical protein